MYIIKTKGTAKIPDYIQIRDSNFILVNHFRADRLIPEMEKYGMAKSHSQENTMITNLPFGVLQKIEL